MEIIDTPRPRIFIFCDDSSHPKPVAVTNFVQIEPEGSGFPEAGRWDERYTSSAAQGLRTSGTTLIGDRLPEPGEILPGRHLEGVRSHYEIRCRRCAPRGNVRTGEPRLFAALNMFAAAGVSSVSLVVLAASLRRIDA